MIRAKERELLRRFKTQMNYFVGILKGFFCRSLSFKKHCFLVEDEGKDSLFNNYKKKADSLTHELMIVYAARKQELA